MRNFRQEKINNELFLAMETFLELQILAVKVQLLEILTQY